MKIQKITIFIFLNLFLFSIASGQTKKDKDLIIASIKNHYTQINNYKNYRIVTINGSEDFLGYATDNGGKLTGYYKGDSLKKIVEWVGLSNKVIQHEYYLNKDSLIFVYSTESLYKYSDTAKGFEIPSLEKGSIGRFYFAKDKLVDRVLNYKQSSGATEKESLELLAASKKYLKLLTQK
ncbi:MAG: hypothetical protein QM802_25615 [Agriterribacter sp.]